MQWKVPVVVTRSIWTKERFQHQKEFVSVITMHVRYIMSLMSQIIMHKIVLITKRVCLNKTCIQWLKIVDICSMIIKDSPKSFLSVAEFLVIMFIPFVLCKLRFNIVCFIAFRFGEGKWILYVRSVSSYKMKISLWCGSIHLVFHMLIISHSNQCPMTCFSMYIHILTE